MVSSGTAPAARASAQRKDALNKIAHRLIADYDRIALEKLLYWPMVKNRHLSKSITNAGWGYLASHLVSKAEEAGRVVCFVDSRRTSKTCSRCGAINTILRKRERRYRCKCGLDMDRDQNAAINILARTGQVH